MKGDGQSQVYFLRVGDFVKIGVSRDARKRAYTIVHALSRNGAPDAAITQPAPAQIIALVPGDRATEAAFHVAFESLRVQGEWFRMDEIFTWLQIKVDSAVSWEPPIIPAPPEPEPAMASVDDGIDF